QADFSSAKRYRKVGRKRRGDTKLARVVFNRADADLICEFQRRDVQRLRQRAAQRDGSFVVLVVVVRRVRPGGSLEGEWRIQDRVVGTSALIDRGSVDVRLERRSNLPQRLGCAIELGEIKVAPANHGANISGSVVDSQQSSLSSRILLQADLCFA